MTVLWIVGLTNSFNFLDNMDGLAASVGLDRRRALRRGAGGHRRPVRAGGLDRAGGRLAGFLVHNHYPARLFMGDAGSNFLGFLLGA